MKVHNNSIIIWLVLWLSCHTTAWGVPVVEWDTVSFHYDEGGFSFYTEMASFGFVGAGIMGLATVDAGGGGLLWIQKVVPWVFPTVGFRCCMVLW